MTATKEVSILLVEDDDIDAQGVERALHKHKILNTIYRARDGQEALEMLRGGQVPGPYMILLDLSMPRMDGFEFLQTIRADERLTKSIVFVLTTSDADEDKTAAYREHIAGYIVKQRVGDGFLEVVELLDRYWRVVELPTDD